MYGGGFELLRRVLLLVGAIIGAVLVAAGLVASRLAGVW